MQDYYYHGISNTPFSVGIALPRDYGKFRVQGEIEVSLAKFNCKQTFYFYSYHNYYADFKQSMYVAKLS